MSTSTTQGYNLTTLLKQTITKDLDRHRVRRKIKACLQELNFIKKGLQLQLSDFSYMLRYQYALNFWNTETGNNPIPDKEKEDELISKLKKELNSQECVYSEDEDCNKIADDFFFKESLGKGRSDIEKSSADRSNEKSVWYVTSKRGNAFYVKSLNKAEAEKKINVEEIVCDHLLICLGDEIQIMNDDKLRQSIINITKSTGLASVKANYAKATFIQDLLRQFMSENVSGLLIFSILSERCQGIWNHIKNDSVLFEDVQFVKDVMKLILLLSQKLSTQTGTCTVFLQDLSSSLFFIDALPKLIQNNASKLSRSDIYELKSLLELMMEVSPQTVKKILKVAKHLASVMHKISCAENPDEDNSQYQSVEFLVHLAEILAKSVPGCEDVDTTNCEWNELPTIPTDEEILESELDLKSLQAIKRDSPYSSLGEYFNVNYKLLREECFRNLCTEVQSFRKRKRYDGRKMKMYRITLKAVVGGDKQVLLGLNCENYNIEENVDSIEDEDASSEILCGSLMCISLDKKFNSLIWAAFVKYDKLQSDTNQNRKTVCVKLLGRNELKNVDVLLELSRITNQGDHALMAESPTFYEAFGPCMDRLKTTFKSGKMPFENELVFAEKSSPPEYMHCKGQKCDWSVIFKRESECDFAFPEDQELTPIEQFKHLENTIGSQCILDETQRLAIQNFLENRVSLIQGPPGTGKSFLGARILHLMLSMGVHQSGPILVMTYKNFALNHFLDACLGFTENIVRVGAGGNDRLKEINLRNIMDSKGIDEKLLPSYTEVTAEMRSLQLKLKSLFKCLSNPRFTLKSFLKAASEFHIRSLLTMSEESDKNIDIATVDRLLDQRKQNAESKELKGQLKASLKRWLTKTQVEQWFGKYIKKSGSELCEENSVLLSVNDEEECADDAIDRKVDVQERKQYAVDDFGEDDSAILKEMDDVDSDEPLCDDIDIPFLSKNNLEASQDVDENLNLWELPENKRVDFILALQYKIICDFEETSDSYKKNAKRRRDILDSEAVNVFKKCHVIGMTVTRAAMRLHLLDQVKPSAVIVEEAAEIIEGQLISVLPPTIKHLVMLGDHMQLKPRLNVYKLKDKHLDCSMFERLINNKMNFTQLGQQCRMRDEIADLLRELKIYKNLKTNREKTEGNEPPHCIGQSLYFLKHTVNEKGTKGNFWNEKEINDIMQVAEYLMKNGYLPDEVTVLCPYREQVNRMKTAFKKRSSTVGEEYLIKLKNIKITTVDSFQGDQNKVILLSLVRATKTVGFFSHTDRICVAISRAQCALYIFGNKFVYAAASEKWKRIIELLEKKGLVKKTFPFKKDCGREDCTNQDEKERSEEQEQNHVDGGKKDPSKQVTRDDIIKMARDITDEWEPLGRALGHDDSTLKIINADCANDIYKKCYEMLIRWTQEMPSNANYGALARGFADPTVKRNDLITKYC